MNNPKSKIQKLTLSQPEGPKSGILIVEDDDIISAYLQRILSELGYDVLDAVISGEEALHKVDERPPDLVLMDIHLAGEMTGIEAAAQIQAGYDIPVVYLTAFAEDAVLQQAKITGPYGYLVKPVQQDQLHATIEMALYKHLMEKKLKESEARHRTLVETIPHGVQENDTAGIITYSNAAYDKMNGYAEGELLGTAIWDLLESDSEPGELRAYLAMLVKDQPPLIPYVTQNRTKDGRVIDIQVDWNYKRDAQGRVTGFASIITDITERKRTEEKLRDSELRYRTLFETSGAGTVILDKEGTYQLVNQKAAETLGGKLEEFAGKSLFDLFPVNIAARYLESNRKIIETGVGREYEETFSLPGGEKTYLIIKQPIKDSSGKGIALQRSSLDITERKRAEAALRESEERYRSLVETSPDAITLTDMDGKIIMCNQQTVTLHGFESIDVLIGRSAFDLIAPEERQRAAENMQKSLEEGRVENIEYTLFKQDGSRFPAELNASAILDETGQPIAFMAITRDITERKRAEAALRYRLDIERIISSLSTSFINCPVTEIDERINHTLKSIAEFAGAVRSSVFLFSDDLTMVSYTHEWCADPADSQIDLLQKFPFDQFGAYATTLKRLDSVIVGRPADIPPEAQSEREWNEKHGFNPLLFVPMILRDTLYGALELYGPVEEERDWPEELVLLLELVADILVNALERKQAEEALREKEETLRVLINAPTETAMLVDLEGAVLAINEVAAQRFGKSVDELVGLSIYDYLPPDLVESRKAQGDKVVRSGKPIRFQDKRAGKYFDNNTYPVLDVEGKVTAVAIYARDITETKQAEEALRASEARYRSLITEMLNGFALHEIICDETGKPNDYRFLEVNPAFEKMTGFSAAEVVGKTARKVLPGTETYWIDTYGQVALTRKPTQQENYSQKFGNYFEILAYSPQQGQFATVFTDITERKQAEVTLRESEERYRSLITEMLNGFALHEIICDETGKPCDYRFLEVNPAFEKMTGFSAAEVVGKTVREVLPRIEAYWIDTYGQVATTRKPVQYQNYSQELDKQFEVLAYSPQQGQFATVFTDITERKRMEESLRESEEKFRTLTDTSPTAISIIRDDQLLYVNPAWETATGFSKKEARIMDPRRVIHPDMHDEVFKRGAARLKGKEVPSQYEVKILTKKEQVRWINFVAIVIDYEGAPATLTTANDITKRKQAEEELKRYHDHLEELVQARTAELKATNQQLQREITERGQVEKRYRDLFEDAPVMYVTVSDQEGIPIVTNCNQLFLTTLNYSYSEVVGQPIGDFYSPKSYAELIGGGYQRALEGRLVAEERQLVASDGRVIETLLRARPEIDSEGRVSSTRAMFMDITKRKLLEEALQKSKANLQVIFDNTRQAFVLIDLDGRVQAMNRLAGEGVKILFGREIREGDFVDDFMRPEDIDQFKERFNRACNGEVIVIERPFKAANGLDYWYEVNYIPVHDDGGEIVGVCFSALNITKRKQAREALRKSEERFRTIFEFAPIGMNVANMVGKFGQTNRAFQEMLGYTEDELWDKAVVDLTHPDDVQENLRLNREIREQKRDHSQREKRYYRKDGRLVWGNVSVVVVRDANEEIRYSFAMIEDITERKQAEEALRESEEKFRSLVTNIPDVIWTADHEDKTTFISANIERIYGYTPEEIYQAGDDALWFGRIHPDDVGHVEETYESLFARAEKFDVEYQIQHKDGHWVWLHDRAIATYEKDGVMYADGVFSDITERKRLAEQLAAIHQLGQELTLLHDEAAIIKRVLEMAFNVFQFEWAGCGLVDEAAGKLRYTYHIVGGELMKFITHLPLDSEQGIAVAVVRSQQTLNVPDVTQDPRYVLLPEEPPIRSELCVPIKVDRQVIGILNAESSVLNYFTSSDQRLLETLADQTAVALENAWLHLEMERRAEQLAAIYQLGRELTLLHDETAIIQRVLETAFNILHFEYAGCGLVDEAAGELRYCHHLVGGEKAEIRVNLPLDGKQGISVAVVRSQQAINVPDVTQDPRYVPLPGDDRFIRSGLYVPIKIDQRVMGILNVDSTILNHFTDADQQLFQTLASQIAVALENARLHLEMEQRAEQLAVLHQLDQVITASLHIDDVYNAFTLYLPRLLACDRMSITLLEEEKARIVCTFGGEGTLPPVGTLLPIESSITSWVVEQGRPLLFNDNANDVQLPDDVPMTAIDIQSSMVIPLRVKGQIVGTWNIGSRQMRAYGPEEMVIAQSMADQLAIAIENARLYEQVQHQSAELEQRVADRTQELSTLYEVTAIASESLDLQMTLVLSLAHVLAALQCQAGAVQLVDETKRKLHLIAHQGLPPDLVAQLDTLAIDGNLGGWVLEHAETLTVPNLTVDPSTRQIAGQIGFETYLGTPMWVGGQIVGVLNVFDKTQRQFSIEDLGLLTSIAGHMGVAAENTRLHQQAEQVAVLEERERLARELHDAVTQSLYSLTLFAEAAQEQAQNDEPERVKLHLSDISAIAAKALKEMRLLIYQLRPLDLAEEGLIEALRSRLKAVEKRVGVEGRVLVDTLLELPPRVEESLYRIAQEALNNTLKHAEATSVTVHIYLEADQAIMEITDNGRGFDLELAGSQGGMGLLNMQKRADKLGGTLTILTAPGQGTTVQVKMRLTT